MEQKDEPHVIVPISFLKNTLSKREMFAMAAMQGMLAADIYVDAFVAKKAVNFADALIEELAKPAGEEE